MRTVAYILMFISINTFAQVNGDWIESGQLKLRVNAVGQLATFNNNPSSEFTPGSNNHLFKFINLWISGMVSDTLYITSINGFNYKSDYSPGPINSLTYAGADPTEWNYVWSVTASEIKEHRKNFQNTNYVVTDAIKNWPSNGTIDSYKHLAPFIDYDQDGFYNPVKGDYPDIIGDKATYFIVNDNYSEHKASGGQPLKIEVYGMAYSLLDLANTVFIKYYIINRTDKNFKDIKVSFHTGFQLGNDKDNYCGTVVSKNIIFAYNGDANDDDHFGTNKPISSILFLNKNLSSTLYIDKDTNLIAGMASSPHQHRYLMEGKWKSSKPLTFSGDGTSNNVASNFIYPGQTDPAFQGQEWVESSTPGERSMLANLSFPTLLSKEFITLDIAISGFDKSDGNPYSFIASQCSEIKNQWAKKVSGTKLPLDKSEFSLKNPIACEENFYEDWFNNFNDILIYNHLGQIIKQLSPSVENTLILNKSGIYYIRFKSENQIITKKILII